MHYVKVENGVVVNRVVFAEPMPDEWHERAKWIANEEAQIGWSYDGAIFTAPPPPSAEVQPMPDPMLAELEALKHRVESLEKANLPPRVQELEQKAWP